MHVRLVYLPCCNRFIDAFIITQGTKDATVNPKYASQIYALLPSTARIRLHKIEGGGHDLSISHSKEVVDALIDLLSGPAKSWAALQTKTS